MTSSLVSVPFATGIDQSLSTVVGEPRITQMQNCRLVAPGRVSISPGYFQTSTPTGARAVVQCDDKTVIVKSVSGLLSTVAYVRDETRVYADTDEAVKWSVPAFEAPTRINLPLATACYVAPTSSSKPHRWMLLSLQRLTLGEAATLYVFDDTTLAQQIALSTSYSSDRYRLATSFVAGANYGYLIKQNSGTRSVLIYSVSVGDTPLVAATVSNSAITSPMIDCAVNAEAVPGWAQAALATLCEDGTVKIFINSGSWSYFGSISVGSSTIAIALTGNELLCIRSTGEAQTYNAQTLAVKSSATSVATPVSVIALSKHISVEGGNKYYLSLDSANATTGDSDSHCYTIDTGTPSGSLTVTEVQQPTLSAIPAGAPFVDASGNPYQVTINNAPLSRSFQVSRVYTDAPLRTRRVMTAAHGEMPLFSAAAQQGGISSRYPAATPQRITLADGLCNEDKMAYLFALCYVTSGTLSETTAKTAAMALIVSGDVTSMGDLTHCITGYDALSVSRTAYGRVLSAGAPFAIGARAVCTGAAIDLPTPVVVQNESSGGSAIFAAGEVYQYILQWEYRAPNGTLFRGPPSQPITHTVTAPVAPSTNVNSMTVSIGFTEESPSMPGLRMRLYRTENGGSVFYDTGASSSSTGIGVYSLTDTTTNASLITKQPLTDGPAVQGGIKARYGFPPHRCSWRGRDRTIVGGLENPRRVRWSLLDFPGEATAFPHASEQGWSADLPDDVVAVAQLDDAWIVFARTRIWSIYGSGPDDNGLSGGFDPPRLISPNLGCVTWKSLAEVEGGLLFQGADGQIYMLTRGQNTIQWFSARVRDELTLGMRGNVLRNPIVATLPHDAAQTIHFVRAPLPASASPIIIYDRRTDAWSTDGDAAVTGLNGAIGGASLLDVFSAARAGQQTVCTLTPDLLTIENATGTPMTPIGATWTAYVTTNDFAPFGFGGWGHIYKIGVVAEVSQAVSISIWEWLSRKKGASDGNGTLTYSDALADFPFLEWAATKTKGSAIRVQLGWADPTCSLSGIVLSVEASQGSQRLQTSRRA